MSVKITGTNELIVELEERFGKSTMESIARKAISEGAEVVKKEINSSITASGNKGYAKGYTVDETTIATPITKPGIVVSKIHWQGPHNRYRIIHFNEWGTIKNPNPPRKGAIARGMRNSEAKYLNKVRKTISEEL